MTMNQLGRDWLGGIQKASQRISGHVHRTPLMYSAMLSQEAPGSQVYVKLESEQLTGSFKLRGAFNKLLFLLENNPDIKSNGPVTASTGNHALASAFAMKKLGITGTIVVPKNISAAKDSVLRMEGAIPCYYGSDCVHSENYARSMAQSENKVYISPYNDNEIIEGQGTIGLEILKDLDKLDAIFVPVGGGGLIGGIAACVKSLVPSIKIYGCQPKNSAVMYESVKAGKIVFTESEDTLSDGTAGGIEEGAVTFDLCAKYVDEWVLVEEEEISAAIYRFLNYHHKVIEGAAGVSIGAFLKKAPELKNQTVAIVACGANISTEKLEEVIVKHKTFQPTG